VYHTAVLSNDNLPNKLRSVSGSIKNDDRRGNALAVQLCRRLDGFGHRHPVSDPAKRGAEMCATRARAVAERLPIRQILPVRTAAGVQHQTLADSRHRFAQAEFDILAAQHIHCTAHHILLEQQRNGRDVKAFPQSTAGTGKHRDRCNNRKFHLVY